MAQTASGSGRPHGSGLGRDGARDKAGSNSNSLSEALAADDDLDAPQIAGRGRTIDALRAFNLCSDGAVEDKVSDKVFVTSPEVSQPRSVSTCSAGSLPDPDSETVTTSIVMSKTSEGESGRTADTAMSLADFGRGISDLGFYAEMNRLNSSDISRLGSSESFARMLSTMGADALVGIPSRTPSITRRITAPAAYGASFLDANLLVASADNMPPPTERVLVTDDAEQPAAAAQVASPKAVRRTQSAGNAPMLPPPMVPRRSGPVLPVFPQAGLAVTGPAAAAVASPSLAPKPVPPIASGAAAGATAVEPAVSAALEVALRGGRQGWVAAAAPAAPGTAFMVSTKATVTAPAASPAAAVSAAAKPAKRGGRRQGKKRKSVSPTPMDDGDIDTNCSPAELKRRRRELRLKRNRESAFRSRLRRKAQNQQMSSELKRLRIATDDQRKDINALRSHAEALTGMVVRLQQALRARGAGEEEVGAGPPQMPGAIWVPPPVTAGRGGGSAGEGEDDVSMAGDGSSGSGGEDRVARATAGRIGLAMMAVVFTFSITLFGVTDIMHHATAHAAGDGMLKGRVLHHLPQPQPQLLVGGQAHAALEVGTDFSNTPALLSPAALLTHVLTAAGVPHLAEMVIAAVALLAIGGSISLFLLGRWTAGVVFTKPSYYSTNGSELPTAFDARCMVDEASSVHSDAGSDDNDEDEPVQAARAKVPSYDKSTMKAAMATQKTWYAPINAALGAAPPLHRAASVSDIPSCFRDPASEVKGKAGKGKSKGRARAGRGRAGTE